MVAHIPLHGLIFGHIQHVALGQADDVDEELEQ
jgi:hypothetical protein